MNERIEHCLYQAGLTASGCWDELDTYEQEAIEKFAELIVREMLDVFDKRAEPGTGFYDPHEPAELIRKHFGVEE